MPDFTLMQMLTGQAYKYGCIEAVVGDLNNDTVADILWASGSMVSRGEGGEESQEICGQWLVCRPFRRANPSAVVVGGWEVRRARKLCGKSGSFGVYLGESLSLSAGGR